jgi:chemotaxis protein methyltransferase WspC
MSFAFQKGACVDREPRTAAPPLPVPARRHARPATMSTPTPRTRHRNAPRTAPRDAPHALPSAPAIEDVQRLADAGRVAEAAEACEAHLRAHGPSAPAFYLMGLVRDARGQASDAEACYRKALYLDPTHSEALAHLALLMDTQGRQADALVLRNRMRRLEFTARE